MCVRVPPFLPAQAAQEAYSNQFTDHLRGLFIPKTDQVLSTWSMRMPLSRAMLTGNHVLFEAVYDTYIKLSTESDKPSWTKREVRGIHPIAC